MPPQLTVVAGIVAPASRPGNDFNTSSSWMGLKRLGRSGCSGMSMPAAIISRWAAGHPPLSP